MRIGVGMVGIQSTVQVPAPLPMIVGVQARGSVGRVRMDYVLDEDGTMLFDEDGTPLMDET